MKAHQAELTHFLENDERSEATFKVESALLRQELSRWMHANYGFDQFEVDFSPEQEDEDDEFVVTKLKPNIRNYLKEQPADYDAYEPMPQISFEKDVD
jgi:hypothetical protein